MAEATRDWVAISHRLGDILPAESGHPAVLKHIREMSEPGHWLVACSGGADSVAVLLWWYRHFPDHRAQSRVLHVNHHQRGDESVADAAFVGGLALALGLDFIHEQEETPGAGSAEADLRELRLRAYARHANAPGRKHPARVITGHQLDDVAETQLMWLARGAGASGLSAPRPVGKMESWLWLLRPFLDLPRAIIRQALEQAGGVWREDRSNAARTFTRNRMRLDVLEAWKAASPGDALRGVSRTRQWMEEDAEAIDLWLRQLFPGGVGDRATGLDLKDLETVPRAVRRRALWSWLDAAEIAAHLNATARESLLDDLDGWCAGEFRERVCASCGRGAVLEITGARLHYRAVEQQNPPAAWDPVRLNVGDEVFISGVGRVRAATRDVTPGFLQTVIAGEPDPEVSCCVDLDILHSLGLKEYFLLRPRKPGDRYRPLGSPGSRKLQDCLTDRKIPQKERYIRPVVCLNDGETLVWFPGLPPCECARLTDASKRALCLTYTAKPAV